MSSRSAATTTEPLRTDAEHKVPNALEEVPDFSLVLGGPLYQLLRRSHLEGDAMELLNRRIVASLIITWLPLFVLSTFARGAERVSFFRDIEVHARFLASLPILIAAELLVHSRLRAIVRRFVEWRIVLPEDISAFRNSVQSAIRIRNSVAVEIALLAVVYTVGMLVWNNRPEFGFATWYALPGSRWNLTMAGYWYVFVSLPLFQFVLLRWYMRLFIWFRFLWQVNRIDPFTLSDAHSRYLLRCQAVERTNTEQVRSILEAAFREYGLPHAIRSDNGPPFATRAVAGLSRLSVYLMKLGIVPERIQPGHPEQNGRLERLHRTLKAETASPPAATRRAQQRAFDHFRREYNQERPHEALGQRTPESCYSVSLRVYPSRVPEPEYGRFMKVRRVQVRGQFKWKDQHVFLTESLAGEAVGLEQIDDRYFTIYFCTQPVARFDSYQLCTQPLPQKKTKLRK